MSFLKTSLMTSTALGFALALMAAPAFATTTHGAAAGAKAAKPAAAEQHAVAKEESAAPAMVSGGDGWPSFRPKQAGDFNVRLRGLGVLTQESGNVVTSTGTPLGLSDEVSSDFVPELDLGYFITKHIATELVLATTRHDVNAGGVPVGKVSLLPPTLTVQYHPLPDSRISPYFGAGLNYTFFYGQDAAGGTITSTKYDDSLGYALQAGVDIAVMGNWSMNFDVKKIFLDTTIHGAGAVPTGEWKTNASLNPVLVGFGFGYRFQ